jgi:flagellum-specific peptidoglycan hydrolase FlgJ
MVAYEYIDAYKDLAIGQMNLHRIPASVILAQAIFESGYGHSELAKRSNNHFGIKCHLTWIGDTVLKSDDKINECFRKYDEVRDSYTDHSLFLKSRPWYAQLFRLELTDYKGWCRGLKEAGYATHPQYAEELIRIIEQNQLYVFDGAEHLQPKTCTVNSWPRIRLSKHGSERISLRDLAQNDLLFGDEHDIVIRSLKLLPSQKTDEKIVARK